MEWVVEDLLPASGLSIMSSRPKVGKSTTARDLMFCVARGLAWLGRKVTAGAVLYVGLEELERKVQEHFRLMGLEDSDPIHVHVGPPPPNGVKWLAETIKAYKPALCVVDPLAHLVSVRDLNDYAQVMGAIRPFLNMARDGSSHVMLLHHSNKLGSGQGREILGSTALLGIVDSALMLDDDGRCRSMYTRQRYGADQEPIDLILDERTGRVTTGRTMRDIWGREIEDDIMEFLEGRQDSADAEEIRNAVGRKAATVGKKLRNLFELGRIERHGEGKRGDPYTYSIPIPV